MRAAASRFAGLGVALLLALTFLAPTLRMPFLGDDTFNNYLDGWMGYQHLTPGVGFARLFEAGNVESGRFYPVFTALLFGEFHFIHSVEVIKWLVVAAIVVNALTLYVLLRLAVPQLALPTIAILPATWQIRFFHDPIVQFSLHMQLTLEFVLLGLIGLVWFARDGRSWKLMLAAGAYALACLTYEPSYAYALVFIGLAAVLVRGRGEKILACVAFAIPPAACAAVAFWFRAEHPLAANDQHAVHAAFGPTAYAFVVQALGAIPLSYRLFNPSNAFVGPELHWGALTIVVAVLAFAACAISYDRIQLSAGRPIALAALISAIGWLASGVIVALSPRWQSELTPGLAYLPVYLADAFVAVMLAALGYAVVRVLPRSVGRYAIAAIGAIVITTTYASNARALARYAPWNMTMPRALDAGLLRDAPEGATVFLDDSYPAQAMFGGGTWDAKNYLYYHTAKRFVAAPLDALPNATPKNAFVLLGWTEGFDRGTAIAGRVVGVVRSGGTVDPLVLSVRRFTRDPGHASVLTTWNSHCGPVVARALLEGEPSAMTLAFVGPFYPEERDGSDRWRWSSGRAALRVTNPTNVARVARLTYAIRSLGSDQDTLVSKALKVAPRASLTIGVTSKGTARRQPPDPRRLLFQVRDATLSERECDPAKVNTYSW